MQLKLINGTIFFFSSSVYIAAAETLSMCVMGVGVHTCVSISCKTKSDNQFVCIINNDPLVVRNLPCGMYVITAVDIVVRSCEFTSACSGNTRTPLKQNNDN